MLVGRAVLWTQIHFGWALVPPGAAYQVEWIGSCFGRSAWLGGLGKLGSHGNTEMRHMVLARLMESDKKAFASAKAS